MQTTSECGCVVDWTAASEAADALLRDAYRIDIYKALDPLVDKDFLTIAQSIANELGGISGPPEAAAVRAALGMLDVDWTTMSEVQRAELVRAANFGMRNIPGKIVPKIEAKLRLRLTETIGSARASATTTLKLNIATATDLVDESMAESMSSIGTWVQNEYGARASMLELGADQVIADGLSQGLRSKDIARDLKAKFGGAKSKARSANYWRTVALNASNRARNFGHLRAMDDGGIREFEFSATMDKRTSNICRTLDGTIFSVPAAMQRFSDLQLQSQGDYQAAETLTPFVQQSRNDDGSISMFVNTPNGGQTVLGDSLQNGVGRADYKPGTKNVLSPAELQAAGVAVPPIHHNCRSTIIANI